MTTTAVSLPRRFASLVKLEHTVFALPFAYVGMLLALGESPSAADWLWVTVAMVGARTLAMSLSRRGRDQRSAAPALGWTMTTGAAAAVAESRWHRS